MSKTRVIVQSIFMYGLAFMLLTFCQAGNSDKTGDKESISPRQNPQSQQLNAPQNPQSPTLNPQAQTDVSDKEIDQYITIAQEIRGKQQQTQQQAVQAIQESDIDVNTYRDIAQSQQNPNQGQDDFTQQEMQAYQDVTQEIQQMQTELRGEFTTIIEEEGMEVQRYQQIVQAIRSDKNLQNQVREKMMEQMPEEQKQQLRQQQMRRQQQMQRQQQQQQQQPQLQQPQQ